jgi:hypothetical protein
VRLIVTSPEMTSPEMTGNDVTGSCITGTGSREQEVKRR